MAASKHTPTRARVRKRESQRNAHHSPQRQGVSQRPPVVRAKAAPAKAPDAHTLQEALSDHIRGLEVAMSAVIVSISALRRQNCDIDADIARVLERSAADRLDVEIERLQSLINKERVHEEAERN